MLLQYCENIPCLKVEAGSIVFNGSDIDAQLEAFYERVIAEDVEYFKISSEYAAGIDAFVSRLKAADTGIQAVKGHITGPFTFAASLKDEKGIALLHEPVFMQVIVKSLTMKALWQLKRFAGLPGERIIFMDEPYLGCFGSAYTPVNKEDVVSGLGEIASTLQAAGALVGVHCCGNTDWSIFTDTPGIGIINFDAFDFLDKFILYADNLKGYVAKGGIICWGIVPTHDAALNLTPQELVEKLTRGLQLLENKGVNVDLLRKNLLVSPACGLGALAVTKVEPIFKLLSGVSAIMRG
ncbi:MAG TPA: hypothetical protein PKL77_02965 [Candidatus Omnitrophota bacterium]|nr:hypothetical protein [Candidatus Omnitrophota bacterium]